MWYKRVSTLLLTLLFSLCFLPSAALAEDWVAPTFERGFSTVLLPEEPEALPEKPEALPEEPEALPEEPEALPEKPEALPEELDALPEGQEVFPDEPEGPEALPEATPPLERMRPPPIGEKPTEPSEGEASNFEEMKRWLIANRNGSGVLTLTDDIIVPAGTSSEFMYLGGYDPDKLIIEVGEYNIYVEGHLLLAGMTVQGKGGENGIFRVAPSGELELCGMQLIGQEGVPVLVQEEGGILVCWDSRDVNPALPAFFYVGELIRSDKLVAKPLADTFPSAMPMAEMRAGFDPTLLPETVPSYSYGDPFEVSYDIVELSVVWDPSTFPVQQEDGSWPRTMIKGSYTKDVVLHGETPPFCLVVFSEPDRLFFERCWVERNSKGSVVTIMLNAQRAGNKGKVQLQSSMDGTTWMDVDGPYLKDKLDWYLMAFYHWEGDPPRYFSLVLTAPDGSVSYSDTIEFSEDDAFGFREYDGGRGGETSPGEGSDLLPNLPEEPPEPEDVPGEPIAPEDGGGIDSPGAPTDPGDTGDTRPTPPTPDDNRPSQEGSEGVVSEKKNPSTPECRESALPLGLVLRELPLIQVKELQPTALPDAVEVFVPDHAQNIEYPPAVPIPPATQEQPKFYAPPQEINQKQTQSDAPSQKTSQGRLQSDAHLQGVENHVEQVYAPEQGIAQHPPQIDAPDQEIPKASGAEIAKASLSQSGQIALGVVAVLVVMAATLLIGRKWKP